VSSQDFRNPHINSPDALRDHHPVFHQQTTDSVGTLAAGLHSALPRPMQRERVDGRHIALPRILIGIDKGGCLWLIILLLNIITIKLKKILLP